MESKELKKWMDMAIQASIAAGEDILEVYDTNFSVEQKEDNSPLTLADKRGHNRIVDTLKPLGLPILSEEGAQIPYSERVLWEYSWTVDPLDGTKEFVKRNGEFTVNVALIHKGSPIGGVIYVPVKKWLYFGLDKLGAYKISEVDFSASQLDLDKLVLKANRLPIKKGGTPYKIVGSRSHMSKETEEFVNQKREEHADVQMVSMGSSLKLCMVAEGAANVYPRFAPTMEWDTAAGQAIVEAAGKKVIDHKTGLPMRYNRENLRNNWFIAQ